jgi:hypothetical protein
MLPETPPAFLGVLELKLLKRASWRATHVHSNRVVYGVSVLTCGIVLFLLVQTLVVGIIDIEEAVQGFSNTGMLTVAMLLIVAAAMQKTGAINGLL